MDALILSTSRSGGSRPVKHEPEDYAEGKKVRWADMVEKEACKEKTIRQVSSMVGENLADKLVELKPGKASDGHT